MKIMHRLFVLAVFAAFSIEPAAAQWQVPDHAVPIGRGSGTGFKYAIPATGGVLSGNASGDPTFQINSVSAKAYGAKCDGTTDDTAALQAWAATLASGIALTLPEGTCIFKSPIQFGTSGASILGASVTGQGLSSILKYTGATTTGDLVVFGFPGTNYEFNQGTVSNFRVTSNTVMTSGAGIKFYKFGRGNIYGVFAGGQSPDDPVRLWNGIVCAGCNELTIVQASATSQNDAFQAYSIFTSTTPPIGCYCGPIYIYGGKWADSASGIHLAAGAAVTIDGADIIGNDYNVLVDTSEATNCNCSALPGNQAFVLGAASFLDSAGTDNIKIDDGEASVSAKFISLNGGIATAGRYNVNIVHWSSLTTVAQVSISGNVNNAQNDGIYLQDILTALTVQPSAALINNGQSSAGWGINCSISMSRVTVLTASFEAASSNASGNIAPNCNNGFTVTTNGGGSGAVRGLFLNGSNPGDQISAEIKNNTTNNNSQSGLTLSTGVSNAYLQFILNNSSGAPFAQMYLGSGVSGGFNFNLAGGGNLDITGGGLKINGSSSGSVTQVAQSAAGTPTVTWGTGSGTPAVSIVNDTNVTGTIGSSGALTLGWAGTLANSRIANPQTTVNGQTCILGSTCTVAAAAGTLTGGTLASGVTASSLTSLGTITNLVVGAGSTSAASIQSPGSASTGIYFPGGSTEMDLLGGGTAGIKIFSGGQVNLNATVYAPSLTAHTAGSGGVSAVCVDNSTGQIYKSSTSSC